MSETRIATRYAKSLLSLAHEKGVLDEVHNDMQQFAQVVRENRQLLLALKNPVIKPSKKKDILLAIFKNLNPMTLSFFEIVTRKNRGDVLPAVAVEFHRQFTILRGIQVSQVVTAFPIGEKLRKQFNDMVKEISGKTEVQLVEKVDRDIIGGFLLTVGDKQIDDSIKSKLIQLRQDLTKNQYIKEF